MSNAGNILGAHDAEIVSSGLGRLALGDLLRRSSRRFGDKAAIVSPERSLSYSELDLASNKVASHILSQGFGSHSRIATLCTNSAAHVAAIFGINKSGHVWVPINAMLSADEIAYILAHAEVSMLLIDRKLSERPDLLEMLGQLAIPVIRVEAAQQDPFGANVAAASGDEPDVRIHERHVAQIMYTSGTTAKAKGVMHCHLAVYVTMLNNIGEWSVTRDDKILIGLPLFHCAGHTMTTVVLAAGGTVHLRNGFDPIDCVETISRERITLTFGLPMMYDAMLKHALATQTDVSSLKLCLYAMAPMPRTLLERLVKKFCPSFALTSGQTEIYPMTTMFRPEQQMQRFGSYWGESAAIDDLAIMDDDGTLLPAGQVGEIVHRGPNVMLGYFKDPEATAAARQFGWHHTGDLGFIDPDGQLVFSDRKKDMIKTGGENVPSILVEEVLLRHPAVSNAAAVGIPHPRWSEAVFAFVTVHPGANVAADDILAHTRQHLGEFQIPKGIVILDTFPMTASGKCKKAELRKQYESYFLDHD